MSERPVAAYVLFAVTAAVMGKALHAIFLEVPTEITMGVVQRIFYFHVTSGWIAYLAFLISGFASLAYLARRNSKWDRWAVSSAEIGVVYCSVVLVTGPIWAKPVWGVWWTWDTRLTSTLVLWLIFVSYLMLRGFLEESSRRATISAVLSIIGCLDAFISYISIWLWRTQHPQPVIGGGGMAPQMWLGLWQALAALLLLFGFLMYQRLQLEQARQEVEALRREVLS